MPHFAERDEKTNSFKQQDAHECWSAIMSSLSQTLGSGSASEQQVQLSMLPQWSFSDELVPENTVSLTLKYKYQIAG